MFSRSHRLMMGLPCCLLLAAAGVARPTGPPSLRRSRRRSRSASQSSARSPTLSTSPAGPRRSIRWTSARGSPATWSRCRSRKERRSRRATCCSWSIPRPYKAQLDQAQGQVDLYQASLKLAKTTLARDRAINSLSPGSVSQQQFDQEQAVGRRGRGPGQGLREEHGDLQAQPRIHQGRSRRSTARSAATT